MGSEIPAFSGSPKFNAQHSPAGAFMSFTCGHFGTGGGIGVEIGKPASQNLFIGVKPGERGAARAIRCLPFMRGMPGVSVVANYEPGHTPAPLTAATIEQYDVSQIRRHYGWATDTWVTPDFSFMLHTPFGPIPEPSADPEMLRGGLLPAIIGTLKVDNRHGTETKTAIFALDFPEAGTRLLDVRDEASPSGQVSDAAAAPARVGFAWRRSMGVMGTLETPLPNDPDALFAFQRWSVVEGLTDRNPIHALGNCAGIAMEVPPGAVRTLVLAIGVYLEGVVTTGIEGRYYYTRLYSGLDDVLSDALQRAPELRQRAARLDTRLLHSGVSPEQQFLIAHGTRSYYGSTQLLDVGGEPFWVVNEGEYCMMNTLDLSIDHAFWELEHNPWVVRNLLNNFTRHYSYHDQVKGGGGQLLAGGVSFTHDMGAHNNFSKPGNSSYELPELTGCFSYMTQEQLCNWVLLAACYVAKTRDHQWLLENAHLIAACAQSMRQRASGRTGVTAHDSSRCGAGQEITTYDSLDESLGQARANSYLAVKCWATWLGIEMLLRLREAASGGGEFDVVETLTDVLAKFLAGCATADGVIPAVLERDSRGYASRILPAIEALVYPAYWIDCLRQRGFGDGEIDAGQMLAAAMRHPLIDVLRRHTTQLLADPQRRNLFPDGGIKLSSTSTNSWMSKIALFQFVARDILRLCEDDADMVRLFRAADVAHVRWQTEGGAFWACSDQFIKGIAKASRYYPRVITAALWLNESSRSALSSAVSGSVSGVVSGKGDLTKPAETPTSSRTM